MEDMDFMDIAGDLFSQMRLLCEGAISLFEDEIPSLRKIVPDAMVQIHPETAKKYGIEDGDWVCTHNTNIP